MTTNTNANALGGAAHVRNNGSLFRNQVSRKITALALSVLFIPTALTYAQDSGTYIALTADQLDQLVAPIALDPD